MLKRIIILLFLIFIPVLQAQTLLDTTEQPKKKQESQKQIDMPSNQITDLWNIFSSSAMGVAFVFLIYAYFELKTAKKNNLDLQNQLIESHKLQSKANETLIQSFTHAIEEYARTIQNHNVFMEKTMRILIKLARSFVEKAKN